MRLVFWAALALVACGGEEAAEPNRATVSGLCPESCSTAEVGCSVLPECAHSDRVDPGAGLSATCYFTCDEPEHVVHAKIVLHFDYEGSGCWELVSREDRRESRDTPAGRILPTGIVCDDLPSP